MLCCLPVTSSISVGVPCAQSSLCPSEAAGTGLWQTEQRNSASVCWEARSVSVAVVPWSVLSVFSVWAGGTAGREDRLFWVHDSVLCIAQCEPQPGAAQAGSVLQLLCSYPMGAQTTYPVGCKSTNSLSLCSPCTRLHLSVYATTESGGKKFPRCFWAA